MGAAQEETGELLKCRFGGKARSTVSNSSPDPASISVENALTPVMRLLMSAI